VSPVTGTDSAGKYRFGVVEECGGDEDDGVLRTGDGVGVPHRSTPCQSKMKMKWFPR
jgi:hypothetical protein